MFKNKTNFVLKNCNLLITVTVKHFKTNTVFFTGCFGNFSFYPLFHGNQRKKHIPEKLEQERKVCDKLNETPTY